MMNSIDGNCLETMDRLSTSTLKRHPKVDLNKNDLLRLLSYLEGELQARDISIATLKTERARHLLYQAKYGRFGLGDPFLALQRDCTEDQEGTFTESSVKILYDNQLMQLENLIETQKKAQIKMQDQISNIERKYHKVLSELEDEKRKHAQDTAQGDDVTYMLEKERGRLKQELDFEKSQRRKLEKDLKKSTTALEEEKSISLKHKQVALSLIKEKKELFEKILLFQERNNFLEKQVQNWGDNKDKSLTDVLAHEKHKLALKMEAAMEKQLSDFDIERERLSGKLNKEMEKSARLLEELELTRKEQIKDTASSNYMTRSHYAPVSFSDIKQHSPSSDSDCKEIVSGETDETGKSIDKPGAFGSIRSSAESSVNQTSYSSSVTSRVPPNVNTVSVTNKKTLTRGVPPPVPPNKPQITIPLLHRKEVVSSEASVKPDSLGDSLNFIGGKKDSSSRSVTGVPKSLSQSQSIKTSEIPMVQSIHAFKRDT